MMRAFLAYLAAAVTTHVLATLSATQYALDELSRLDIEISVVTRLATTVHDIGGMALTFLPMTAVAFAIAFPVTSQIAKRIPRRRDGLYMLAGALAIVAIHVLMKWALGIWMILVARTLWGLVVQALAGAAGGLLFARLTLSPQIKQSTRP